MIQRTELSEICADLVNEYGFIDREFLSLLVKLSATLWYTGTDRDGISSILALVAASFDARGRESSSKLIKGWSNCIRSILSLEPYDTTGVGYCKRPRNCRYALRKVGATRDEIDIIVRRYDHLCGIPPVLLLPSYWRVLLGNGELSLYRKVVPLSNLGRASPVADLDKCEDSERAFFETTMNIHGITFDLSSIGSRYGELCKNASSNSRIALNSHGSFDYGRGMGGKNQEFAEQVVDRFLYKTVDELVVSRPASDLFDVLGNLALKREAWGIGVPILEVLYPLLPRGNSNVDGRLGFFGLLWAIYSLHDEFPNYVTSDSQFIALGTTPPILGFEGELPSRVCTLAEEGFKARVITIVKLSAAIIQGVARFFTDHSMRTDPLVKIGLLSKVKLYDFLVKINLGDRRGVVDYNHPSCVLASATSADLTTATDTPPMRHTSTLLNGYMDSVSTDTTRNILKFATQIGTSRRVFVSRLRPINHVHRNGIMMGEGLSGTFLNTISAIVRCVILDFMEQFDFYIGVTEGDAREFMGLHQELIQDFLDTAPLDGFQDSSTQSGDDLIFMSHHDCIDIRRYIILLYVCFGLVPSSSTFYSNNTYCTFTEEAAVRTELSLGWVFVDCIKPRLFNITSQDGIISILSHISQITSSVRYLRDEELTERACDIVDTMITCNRVIHERITRYNIVPGFPSWLGGLDHPICCLGGTEHFIPEEDRSVVRKLLTCDLEDLFIFKYSWAFDDLPQENEAAEIRRILKYVYGVFTTLPEGSMDDPEFQELHTYPEEELVARELFPSYNSYREELASVKNDLGLVTLDDLVSLITSGLKLRVQLDSSSDDEDVNPMITLRRRREFLISGTQAMEADPHEFTWSDIRNLDWRMKISYRGKVVSKDTFLLLVELDDLPSLSVSASTYVGGG